MGKKSAPPPPDYAALAKQQGQDSRETAQFNSELNRVDQYTPNGSLTWSSTMGPDGKPRWAQTTTLSPEQQALQNGQNALSQKYLDTAQSAVDRVAGTMGQSPDFSGIPGTQYLGQGGTSAKVNTPYMDLGTGPSFQTNLPQPGKMPDAPSLSSVSGGSIARDFDTSKVRALNSNVDDASRRRVEEAIMSRLNPQYQQDEQALRTRLLNSGIEVGTDAYNREMNNFSQRLNDARMQSVLAGGQEESRQVGLNASLQGQEFNQAYQKGQFAQNADSAMASNAIQAAGVNNAAALGAYNAQLAAQGQQFNQGLAASSFYNNAQQQQFQNRMAGASFANNAADTATQRQLQIDQLTNAMETSRAGFNNSAAQNAIQLEAYKRQLPLNEANALRTGSQVQGPQFGGYYTGGQAQGAQYLDAGIAQGNYNLASSAQEMAGRNALIGGLAQLGGSWAGSSAGSSAIASWLPSDPRLKSNIVRVGTHPLGIGIYEYDIAGTRTRGVMSTEARTVMPEAVMVGADGFDRVNYSLIGEL